MLVEVAQEVGGKARTQRRKWGGERAWPPRTYCGLRVKTAGLLLPNSLVGVALADATCARATVIMTQIANPACPASIARAVRWSLAAPATESVVMTTASRPGDLLFGLLHAPISRLISHCLYGVSISLHVSVLSKAAAAYTSFWARRGG